MLQLAGVASVTSGWCYAVALYVYAFQRDGPAGLAAVSVLTTIPAAVVAPFAAVLIDRWRRERVMAGTALVRGVVLAAAAVLVLEDGPVAAVFALAAIASILSRVFYPAQIAVLPAVSRSAAELSAATVVTTQVDSLGLLVGPAIGGLLLGSLSNGGVIAVASGGTLLAAALVATVRVRESQAAESEGELRLRNGALEGFRTVFSNGRRIVIGLYTAQVFVAGALNVLLVAAAIKLLGLGGSGVGYLNTALGLGGLLGAVAAVRFVARDRLRLSFLTGLALWGVPIALIGLLPGATFAVFCLAVVGIGNTLVDVACFTFLQRSVDARVRGRVFGVIEGLTVGISGTGSLAAAPLISAFGVRASLVGFGASLTALALLSAGRLDSMEVPSRSGRGMRHLVEGVPFLAVLPPAAIDDLAERLRPCELHAGDVLFREGDLGDGFYIIESARSASEPAPTIWPTSAQVTTSARSHSFEALHEWRPCRR